MANFFPKKAFVLDGFWDGSDCCVYLQGQDVVGMQVLRGIFIQKNIGFTKSKSDMFCREFPVGWSSWIRTSGMTESKSVALPLGYTPDALCNTLYHKIRNVSSVFFGFFLCWLRLLAAVDIGDFIDCNICTGIVFLDNTPHLADLKPIYHKI